MIFRIVCLALFLTANACASVPASQTSSLPLFIVHFETGQNWDSSLAASEQSGFTGHSQNLQALRREGTIVFGARYGDVGLIILRYEGLQSATDLIAADPGIQSGIFVFRIEPLSVFYDWRD